MLRSIGLFVDVVLDAVADGRVADESNPGHWNAQFVPPEDARFVDGTG